MTMMSDGLKGIGDDKPVKDISEIMLENLEAKNMNIVVLIKMVPDTESRLEIIERKSK